MIEIPLQNGAANAHQKFSQRLNGMLVSFEVNYVTYSKSPYWIFNLYQDGFPLALGVPLNPNGDLLANHAVKNFGRLVFVGDEPTLDNLGITNNLVWVPEE